MGVNEKVAALIETMARLGVDETMAADATLAAPRPGGSQPRAADKLPSHPSLPSLSTLHGDGGDTSDLRVLSLLGEGGMGRVELAEQHSLGREVAVKSIRPDRATADSVEQLVREARITGALEHPNIIPVHALARDAAGRPVLLMKHVEGVVWRQLIRDPDHPAWRAQRGDRLVRHLEILMQLCNAMEFAHSRGVVHRDLKPDNVMVGAFGEVYVLDWGLAAHLDESGRAEGRVPVGTPAYMAPEMIEGTATARSDVYLLGAMLHEALTGRPRHDAPTLVETLRAAILSRPFAYPPAVPSELAAIANRATHTDPAARHASAAELRDALADFLVHRGSVELADEAALRLRELAPLVARAGDPEAALQVRKLGAECRFGFQQALRAWEGNRAARDGLQACLAALIEHELSHQRDCAPLLAELPDPRPDLATRLEALQRKHREDEAARAELLRRERDEDRGIHARIRALGVTVVTLVFLAGASYQLWIGARPTWRVLLAAHFAVLAAMLVVVTKDRRAILSNRFSWLSASTSVAIVAGSCLFLVVAMVVGVPPEPTLVVLLAAAAIWQVTLGLTFERSHFAAAACCLLCAGVSAWRTDLALTLYLVANMSAIAIVGRAISKA